MVLVPVVTYFISGYLTIRYPINSQYYYYLTTQLAQQGPLRPFSLLRRILLKENQNFPYPSVNNPITFPTQYTYY